MVILKKDSFHSATIASDRLLPGIHGLRGIAALAVVLYHLQHLTGVVPPTAFRFIGLDFGYGAHLFFVLSAFSLMHSTEHTIHRSGWARAYLLKRFFRIAPLFYTMIIFELVRQALMKGVAVNVPTILLNVLFVFDFVPSSGFVWGGWTIGVEFVFYVLLPILLLLVTTTRTALVLLLVTLLISYAARHQLHTQYLSMDPRPLWDLSYFTFLPNMYFFAAGIFAFKVAKSLPGEGLGVRFAMPFCASIILGVLMFTDIGISLMNGGRLDLMMWALGFIALCVWQSVRPSVWSANKLLEFFGERSFSIYLLHPVLIVALKGVVTATYANLAASMGAYAYFVCAGFVLGVVLLTSELTYRLVEVPGIKLGRKVIKLRGGVAATA